MAIQRQSLQVWDPHVNVKTVARPNMGIPILVRRHLYIETTPRHRSDKLMKSSRRHAALSFFKICHVIYDSKVNGLRSTEISKSSFVTKKQQQHNSQCSTNVLMTHNRGYMIYDQ